MILVGLVAGIPLAIADHYLAADWVGQAVPLPVVALAVAAFAGLWRARP